MLHARDSLFSMVRRYTAWVTLARRCESLEQPESTVRYTPPQTVRRVLA